MRTDYKDGERQRQMHRDISSLWLQDMTELNSSHHGVQETEKKEMKGDRKSIQSKVTL